MGERVNRVLRRAFPLFERLGVHVTPVHYYQPIPDSRDLDDVTFARRTELVGVDLRSAAQLELLDELERSWAGEYRRLPRESTGDPTRFHLHNHTFGPVDAELLWAMVRRQRPHLVVEIGSGFSTLLLAQALGRNAHDGHPGRLVAVEPFPSDVLRGGVAGLDELVTEPLARVPMSLFEQLGAGDILFIDSSHVLRIDSDVRLEFLEILPRLSPEVVVHVHDIFLPAEYPRVWLESYHWYWTEQYLLQAFLTGNHDFEVLLGAHWLHLEHPSRLRAAIPSYDPETTMPGSFWMRRVT